MGMTVALICITIIVLIIVIVIAVLLYHQMLLTNEINKRLLVLAETAVTQEANTVGDMQARINELEELVETKNNPEPKYQSSFHDNDLDL